MCRVPEVVSEASEMLRSSSPHALAISEAVGRRGIVVVTYPALTHKPSLGGASHPKVHNKTKRNMQHLVCWQEYMWIAMDPDVDTPFKPSSLGAQVKIDLEEVHVDYTRSKPRFLHERRQSGTLLCLLPPEGSETP